jgi:cytoskeletal protein CcmA (bactofilin family)
VAFFDGKKGGSRPQVPVDTLVGAKVVFRGDIVFSGGLHVDGTVVGMVSAEPGAEALLMVSERGRIEGEIRVPHVVIDGVVKGDIHAHGKVELAAHARIEGNIHYRLLEMAAGAEVNGRIRHDEAPAAPGAPPAADPPP